VELPRGGVAQCHGAGDALAKQVVQSLFPPPARGRGNMQPGVTSPSSALGCGDMVQHPLWEGDTGLPGVMSYSAQLLPPSCLAPYEPHFT